MKNPLISIITVVLNDQVNIEKTILSVLNQNFKNIEYIVIDGKSEDNTTNIIRKYIDQIKIFKSDNDQGIYDAVNKGLDLANGDLIGFVNSGDTFTKESLNYLVKYYNDNQKADFFFGAVRKHWGVLHGYKRWKIHFTWGFYLVIQPVSLLKRKQQK